MIEVSVLTSSEDLSSLKSLADGLVSRYATAGVEPPVVMHTAETAAPSKVHLS